jgi:uncharacterized membrane protein (DUF373 family)
MDPHPEGRVPASFETAARPYRRRLLHGLLLIEEGLYVLLSLLLTAVTLWVLGGLTPVLLHPEGVTTVVLVLDRLLLVLMLIELLHTLVLFLRTHHFRHEPFLVIGIIAGVRRILILTAEASARPGPSVESYLLELGVTALVVLVFALALRLNTGRRPI